jgi:hypothetical protein
MSDDRNVPNKIKIFAVEGGTDHEQGDLESCYFLQLGNRELSMFFDPKYVLIPTAPAFVTNGVFTFIRDGKLWMIDEFFINPKNANGKWRIIQPLEHLRRPGLPEEDNDGAFQAQAGPTVEDAVASATA